MAIQFNGALEVVKFNLEMHVDKSQYVILCHYSDKLCKPSNSLKFSLVQMASYDLRFPLIFILYRTGDGWDLLEGGIINDRSVYFIFTRQITYIDNMAGTRVILQDDKD